MRELDIVNDLVETCDYLSMEYFINKYSISKRTLQNVFSQITNDGKTKGFHLIQKRGRGYLLEVVDNNKFDKFIDELNQISNGPKVNVENIVGYIALHDNYITIDKLIDVFETSRSLIKGYKDEVDTYLSKYNLKMDRKAHYGIKIANSFIEHRNLLVDLYIKKNPIIKEAIDINIENNFKDVENALINKLKIEDLNINYTELSEILAWLKVTIYINLDSNTPIDSGDNMEIVDVIQEKFAIGIGKSDSEELFKLIKKKSRNNNYNDEKLKNITSDINGFLIEIDKDNNTSFNADEDFNKLLVTHIASLINRSHFKISYTNPIIDELSIKYPMVFNMAISLGTMLENKYEIKLTRDEIGFIVTYFAVYMEKEIIYKLRKYNRIAIVCSSGGGSAYLIKLKLASLFELSNIKTFSILEMDELEGFNPDIIFSITELTTSLKVPLIYIKELLDDYDILNIKQLIMFGKREQSFISKAKEYYVERFFDSNYFQVSEIDDDYIKCLEDMSIKIESSGIGGDNYSDFVLRREAFSPTIYLNGVAIPHPIEMKGNKDLVSVKILKKPIIYKDKKVSIIFMVSLQKSSLELHKEITKDLFEIMTDVELVQAILKVTSFKEFIALINRKV